MDERARRRAIERAKRLAIAEVRARGYATMYGREKYGWKYVDDRIVERLDDETFHLRIKGIDFDGNQLGEVVDLKVNENGTIEELPPEREAE